MNNIEIYAWLFVSIFISIVLFLVLIIVNDINSFSDFSKFCKKIFSTCLQNFYLKVKNNPKRPVPQYIKEVKYGGYKDDYVEELIDYSNALECKIIELESEIYKLQKKSNKLQKKLNRTKTKGDD